MADIPNKDQSEADDSSETNRKTPDNTTLENSRENHSPKLVLSKDSNGALKDRDRELPEPIKVKTGRQDAVSGLPSIGINELTSILRDPNMPSQKIMHEVADKILLLNEESEGEDGISDGAGGIAMKGVLDCIFEVTYKQTASENSDDEDDENFQRIPRQIPCKFCSKIFSSSMVWKTHVLVAHRDPSVLNIRRLTPDEAQKIDKTSREDVPLSGNAGKLKEDTVLSSTLSENTQASLDTPARDDSVKIVTRRFSISRPKQKGASFEIVPIPHKAEAQLSDKIDETNQEVASSGSNQSTSTIIPIETYQVDRKTPEQKQPKDSSHISVTSVSNRAGPSIEEERVESSSGDSCEPHHIPNLVQSVVTDQSQDDPDLKPDSPARTEEHARGNRKRRRSEPELPSSNSSLAAGGAPSSPKHSRVQDTPSC